MSRWILATNPRNSALSRNGFDNEDDVPNPTLGFDFSPLFPGPPKLNLDAPAALVLEDVCDPNTLGAFVDMGGADDVPLDTCDESTELCSVTNGFDNEDDVPNPTLGFEFSPLFPVPPKLNLDAPAALVLEDVCDPNTLGAFVDMGGADDVPLDTCDESKELCSVTNGFDNEDDVPNPTLGFDFSPLFPGPPKLNLDAPAALVLEDVCDPNTLGAFVDMGGADDVPLDTCDESKELCSVTDGFDNEDDVPNPTLGFEFSPLFPVPPKLNLDAPAALVLEDVCDPNTLGAFVDMGGADDVPLVTCDESKELCSVTNGFDNEDDVPNPTLGFDFSPLFPGPPKLNLDAPAALVLEDVCDPNTLGAFVDMGGADDVPLVTFDESPVINGFDNEDDVPNPTLGFEFSPLFPATETELRCASRFSIGGRRSEHTRSLRGHGRR